MFVSLQNSRVEILTSNVLEWRGCVFRRCWGHGGAALMNAIRTLIKETPKRALALSTMWEYKKHTTGNRAFTQPCWHPSVRLLTPQNYKKFLLCMSQPVCGTLSWQPKQSKTILNLTLVYHEPVSLLCHLPSPLTSPELHDVLRHTVITSDL